MEYRQLGRTRLKVSAIGLGTKYLFDKSQTSITNIVRTTMERGVNYFDLLMPESDYHDCFGMALKREQFKMETSIERKNFHFDCNSRCVKLKPHSFGWISSVVPGVKIFCVAP